ncbi:MAG: hypothetical protein AAGG81_00230 [Chlamydiota bacterium]
MHKRIFIILSLLVAVSCQEETSLKETDDNPVYLTEIHLGQGYLDQINNAEKITLSRIRNLDYGDYEVEPVAVDLELDDMSELKDILLNDRSYVFDLRKRCVFVPEYVLEFSVKERKLLLLYAPLCKEFKLPYGQFKAQIIEIDPSFKKIEELLKKYKQQLEVSDENNTSIND